MTFKRWLILSNPVERFREVNRNQQGGNKSNEGFGSLEDRMVMVDTILAKVTKATNIVADADGHIITPAQLSLDVYITTLPDVTPGETGDNFRVALTVSRNNGNDPGSATKIGDPAC